MDTARQLLEPPRLLLDMLSKRVRAGRVVVQLNERELALLSVFAKRVLEHKPAIAAPGKYVNDETWSHWRDVEQQPCKPWDE